MYRLPLKSEMSKTAAIINKAQNETATTLLKPNSNPISRQASSRENRIEILGQLEKMIDDKQQHVFIPIATKSGSIDNDTKSELGT